MRLCDPMTWAACVVDGQALTGKEARNNIFFKSLHFESILECIPTALSIF